MRLLALSTIAVVVLATLIADSGYGDQAFRFLRHIPGRDVTGHFLLFGLLGYFVAGWARRSGGNVRPGRWLRVVVAVGVLVTLEEFSQMLIRARSFSLVDLTATLAGLSIGSALSAWPRRRVV